jgi:hypothetical protein
MLAAPHVVDRLVPMRHDVELGEYDLGLCLGQVRARGLYVGLPHFHGHSGDAIA